MATEGGPPVSDVDVLSPRDVPLGGPRAMTVRRTLPQRARTLIGAWCFADHYGPDDIAETGGMEVAPHPHTGLQTVSWLFSGEIEHRDSLGSHAYVRPGELNLMTGGHGISHSEVSTPRTTILHGVQLWVALPEEHRHAERNFQHHVPEPLRIDGAEIRVFLGSLAGQESPVATFTPLLGAEIVLEPRATVTFAVDPGFEHGLLVDHGDVRMADTLLRPAELGYAQPGATALTLTNESDGPARTVLLGGTPFEEQIVMWWNFIGRSHEDIVRAREDWANASDRFGAVEGYPGDRLPAPVLPNAVITPRGNPPRRRPAPEGHPMTESPASPAAATVERNDARHRYEILVDGKRAGLTAYRDRGEQRVFFHTEIDDAFAGQGLAAQLVQYALTDVRDLGMRIVPVCPYVAKFLKKHDEFADVTEPVTPEVLAWLDAELG
ncbi:bifunctional pirin family protein/GNAT family N-acetyltransferase [Streptomyces sp. NBC_01764]|uniref:bifunctional pirin family protein/GNAT family N-acetyltransferase n=1 Tax=Streptomyces sp. NBC_01764 TaxID=2975935 RepID=UPI00224FC6DD|nr:bifunctional pirin family protein/GNAT family N-acetyltransferase [Streptomyces sp. NBC_01764]MCX4403444.1 bifunctional pirin family protein/GNAT family N-acetyltransferase [Streptomyces sp. NBC_01764]